MIYFVFYFFHHVLSGSNVYINVVFASMAFKPFSLGQTFWIAFHKLFTISCWTFAPYFLTEHVFFSSVPTYFLLDHDFMAATSIPWFLTFKLFCCNYGNMLGSHWRFEKRIWRRTFNFLIDVFRCCFNISTDLSFLMMLSILWSDLALSLNKETPQDDFATLSFAVAMIFQPSFFFPHPNISSTFVSSNRGQYFKTIFISTCSSKQSSGILR